MQTMTRDDGYEQAVVKAAFYEAPDFKGAMTAMIAAVNTATKPGKVVGYEWGMAIYADCPLCHGTGGDGSGYFCARCQSEHYARLDTSDVDMEYDPDCN